jgi:hypothetical protein
VNKESLGGSRGGTMRLLKKIKNKKLTKFGSLIRKKCGKLDDKMDQKSDYRLKNIHR